MTKKIVWRLKEQPSTESLRDLVKDGILTKDEAREVLFYEGTSSDTTQNESSLFEEVQFLRKLVDKLSEGQVKTAIEYIIVQQPYYKQTWYTPYVTWCNASNTKIGTTSGTAYHSTNFASIQ